VLLLLAVLPFLVDLRFPSPLRSPVVLLGTVVVVLAATAARVLIEPASREVHVRAAPGV